MNAKEVIGLAGLLALLAAGCVTTGPQFDARQPTASATTNTNDLASVTVPARLNPQWLRMPTNLFTLGPGDKLEIEVLGDPTTRATTLVGPDGKIYYFLLPGVDVWGKTLTETKALLERELKMYFREEPQVAITLRGISSKQVWLLGRLNAPGIYPLATPMTLLESLSLAGGPRHVSSLATASLSPISVSPSLPDELADLKHSFVMRNGHLLPVDFDRLLHQGDMSQNIYLQPDDFVYLPPALANEIYVLGAVAQPKPVYYAKEITLVSAIANAGGTIKDAYLTHVAIVRGSLAKPEVSVIDYRAITRGKATDVVLEPRDIVYIPFTPYQTITRYVDLILDTFVRTVGANEGARAVMRNAAPVSVNVPIGAP